ncbi:MAG: indolepyruvate oxidoreductase subunit beta [Eggerthellaceae bacterium]|jgi:indolepyruvate ferredoxin oxidoreductase beta subunit|nr:indolepyruvate oxidoreductase subunit beta [Eggerthellaceae bacterium]
MTLSQTYTARAGTRGLAQDLGGAGATPVTVLLCGVGGQGTILAADLLARTAQEAGYQVKLSEVHGMAQRGGAVTTVVRFGSSVASMVTDPGCADHIIAFETTEALRNLPFLKAGGDLLVNDETIRPLTALTGKVAMPSEAASTLKGLGARLVSATRVAEGLGNAKCSNIVLLGALAKDLGMDETLWERQIEKRVPARFTAMNIAAFRAGLAYDSDEGGKATLS